MAVLGRLVALLVVIATLLQGIEAGLCLLDRWRKSRARDGGGTRAGGPARGLFGIHIRLTQGLVMLLMFGSVYYLGIAFEVWPMYLYFSSVLPLYDTVLLMVGYFGFAVLYPWMVAEKPNSKRLLTSMLVVVGVNFALANLSLFVPGFSEAKWYPIMFAVANAVSFAMFRLSLIYYLIKEYFVPWMNSLPER